MRVYAEVINCNEYGEETFDTANRTHKCIILWAKTDVQRTIIARGNKFKIGFDGCLMFYKWTWIYKESNDQLYIQNREIEI